MSHNQNPRPCHPLTSVVRRMNPALPRVLFNRQFLLLRKQRRRVETVNLCVFNRNWWTDLSFIMVNLHSTNIFFFSIFLSSLMNIRVYSFSTEPRVLRIETKQVPAPSQPEVVLSDGKIFSLFTLPQINIFSSVYMHV